MERVFAGSNGYLRRTFTVVDGQILPARHRMGGQAESDDLSSAGAKRSAAGTLACRTGAFALAAQQADHSALDDQLGFLELGTIKTDFHSLGHLEAHGGQRGFARVA